jgi:hypothetical protein
LLTVLRLSLGFHQRSGGAGRQDSYHESCEEADPGHDGPRVAGSRAPVLIRLL